jgi:hypothetical protein
MPVLGCFSTAFAGNPDQGVTYVIEVRFENAASLAVSKALGLKGAQIWKSRYSVAPETYNRLKASGVDCRLVGGVTELAIKSDAVNPLAQQELIKSNTSSKLIDIINKGLADDCAERFKTIGEFKQR